MLKLTTKEFKEMGFRKVDWSWVIDKKRKNIQAAIGCALKEGCYGSWKEGEWWMNTDEGHIYPISPETKEDIQVLIKLLTSPKG